VPSVIFAVGGSKRMVMPSEARVREMLATYASFALASNPVIIIGSGSSMGANISGMGQLASWLCSRIQTNGLSGPEADQWTAITQKLQAGIGLELALQSLGNHLSKSLTSQIVEQTWILIRSDERKPLLRIAAGDDVVGLIRLFDRFRRTTQPYLNVVTTNYDHLIEWSAARAHWYIWDGFDSGDLGYQLDSHEVSLRMQKRLGHKKQVVPLNIQHVRLYKPHGSLSWFRAPDGTIVRMPSIKPEDFAIAKEMGFSPLIVTPGLSKYFQTHEEPFSTVMKDFQEALDRCRALIFVGFGFNDLHIQARFLSHLQNATVPKVIVTRGLNDSFHEMVTKGTIRNFVAIEEKDNGSYMWSDKLPAGQLERTEAWTLRGLLNIAWGEE
jgi:hypothetical protein